MSSTLGISISAIAIFLVHYCMGTQFGPLTGIGMARRIQDFLGMQISSKISAHSCFCTVQCWSLGWMIFQPGFSTFMIYLTSSRWSYSGRIWLGLHCQKLLRSNVCIDRSMRNGHQLAISNLLNCFTTFKRYCKCMCARRTEIQVLTAPCQWGGSGRFVCLSWLANLI